MTPSLTLPKASIDFEKNVWADYVEIICLTNPDGEISLSDILTIASEDALERPKRGSDETGEQEDAFYQKFLDTFKYLENRAYMLNDAYPFSFTDEDTISIDFERLSTKQTFYLFLLYCSNLSRFSKPDQQCLTKEFEVVSKYILQQILPSFHIEIFGTASSPEDMFYGGKLIERFEKLAHCLHTEAKTATRENPRYNQASGDGGLDLIGFTQIDSRESEVPFIPSCFAQCACSVDKWKEKQSSIKFDEWNQRFNQIAHYCEFIFVPFSLRGPDGKWSNTEVDRIVVIPVDRVRFLHIIQSSEENLTFLEHSNAYRIIQESVSRFV